MLSSYGTSFFTQRCSPHEMPLSDVNTISVFAKRPVSRRAPTSASTCESTLRSVRYWFCRNPSTAARASPESGGRSRMYDGLSETSGSS